MNFSQLLNVQTHAFDINYSERIKKMGRKKYRTQIIGVPSVVLMDATIKNSLNVYFQYYVFGVDAVCIALFAQHTIIIIKVVRVHFFIAVAGCCYFCALFCFVRQFIVASGYFWCHHHFRSYRYHTQTTPTKPL